MSFASKFFMAGILSTQGLTPGALECGAEKCVVASEDSSLLQVPVYPHTRWAWRTAVKSGYSGMADDSEGPTPKNISAVYAGVAEEDAEERSWLTLQKSCNDVCNDHGAVCVPEGFKEASCVTGVQFAHLSASGKPCEYVPTQVDTLWAPYHTHGHGVHIKGCFFSKTHNISAARCEERPPTSEFARLCPCSTTPPHSVQLEGTYCSSQVDIKIDCKKMDDFKSGTNDANICRILNGFYTSPVPHTTWEARRTIHASPVSRDCTCKFMELEGGLGDNCRDCSECAVRCRAKNSRGTCR